MSAVERTSPARRGSRSGGTALAVVVSLLVGLSLTGCGSAAMVRPAASAAPAAAQSSASPARPAPVASAAITEPAKRGNEVAGSAAGLAGQELPPGVPAPPAGSNQLVTVLVATPGSTTGTLRAWQRGAGGAWSNPFGPVQVKVGTAGVGTAQEGLNRTPRGTFPLDQAFGRQPNPGTALAYRRVGGSDWWVSDPKSPAYNTFQTCAPGTCPFDEGAGENLGKAGPSYDYAIVIGYNTNPVRPGAGSAFFVHVDAGVPSAGCVQAPRAAVVSLLRWLNPGQHPRITVGLG